MKYGRGPSWQIGIDEPEHLLIGLFIRDVAGLGAPTRWPPPAEPPISPAGGSASAAAKHQWQS